MNQNNNRIITSITEKIGQTPLYRPLRWLEEQGYKDAEVSFKLEGMNSTGSVKDRAALGMILDLEERDLIKEGTTLIEPTSGNTGISLAALAAARGYKAIMVMPETMSEERRKFFRAYGAELVLTAGDKGMKGAIEEANRLVEEKDDAIIPSQFANPANPTYHEKTTGPEIWEQSDGKVDVLVLGVGTGGTLTGAGRYLRSKNPSLEIIAVEPESSAVLSGKEPGKHGIQGIGAGFIPENLDQSLVDRVITIKTDEAIDEAKAFAKREGIFVGISSGAALAAVKRVLAEVKYQGKAIVSLLPDSGDRYLSTKLLEEA